MTIDDYERWLPRRHLGIDAKWWTATRGDDCQLLLGVNRQTVSPLMQGPSSAPFQELVIGSHTTELDFGDVFTDGNYNMKLFMRHRQGSELWMNVFLYDDIYFKIDRTISTGWAISFLFLTLTLISYFYILKQLWKKNMFIGSL